MDGPLAHDLEGWDALMDYLSKADFVLSDKAYDADERVRKKLEDRGCHAVIPDKKNLLQPLNYDKYVY